MIGLLQRVSQAWVEVDGRRIAGIGAGLLVLVGVERDDDAAQGERLLDRLLRYRIFPDAQGRMQQGLTEHGGGLLLVPQFTLAADTGRGLRPGFTPAAEPAVAQRLYEALVAAARSRHPQVDSGRFGAQMQVGLINDGPVTFWLQSRR